MNAYQSTCAMSGNMQDFLWAMHKPKRKPKRKRHIKTGCVSDNNPGSGGNRNNTGIDKDEDVGSERGEEKDAGPALWDSPIHIQAFLDACMHHLLYGVTATITIWHRIL